MRCFGRSASKRTAARTLFGFVLLTGSSRSLFALRTYLETLNCAIARRLVQSSDEQRMKDGSMWGMLCNATSSGERNAPLF